MADMVKAIMDSLIEMTVRAIHAEDMVEALKANITKLEEDKTFWRRAYDRMDAEVNKLKEELASMKGEQDGEV